MASVATPYPYSVLRQHMTVNISRVRHYLRFETRGGCLVAAGTCQVARLVRRPGGPPRQNVEVGQTNYAVNRGRIEMEGREGSEGQSHKKERREQNGEGAHGT